MNHQSNQAHVDDLLRDLAAELVIEPSASFGSRVRAGVESLQRKSLVRSRGVWTVVAAAAVAGVLVFVPRAVRNGAALDPPPTRPVPVESVAPVATVVGSQSVMSRPVRQRTTGARPQHDPQIDHRLEVLTTQPTVIRALWARSAAFAQLAQTEVPDAASVPEKTSTTLSVEPVKVEPIIVSRIGGDRRGPGDPKPDAQRLTTEMSPRSAK